MIPVRVFLLFCFSRRSLKRSPDFSPALTVRVERTLGHDFERMRMNLHVYCPDFSRHPPFSREGQAPVYIFSLFFSHFFPLSSFPLLTRQDHRGSISWVTEAFGAQWGFVDAVWSLATSFLDNALYPIIIADFLGLSGAARWAFVYCSIAALTWAVYRGSDVSSEEACCQGDRGHNIDGVGV